MTIKELNALFHKELKGVYIPNEINSLFKILCEKEMNYNSKDLLLRSSKTVSQKKLSTIFSAIGDLKKHKPIQYILGETEFYGLKIQVNKNVLIPRPETEELVDWIITEVQHEHTKNTHQILDIGTGSGCIAIALKKNLPDAEIDAMDISEKAISVAKENAKKNSTQITFLVDNILNIQSRNVATGRSIFNPEMSLQVVQYSIIVSNPPYIKISESKKMQKNVLHYEPYSALFVDDDNPLKYYEFIVKFAKIHLRKSGFVYFEINEQYGKEIYNLLAANGFYEIVIKKDLSEKDRMIRAKK